MSIAYSASWTQALTRRILDGESGEGLDYVNIRVVGKTLGVINSKGGEFTIDLSKTQKMTSSNLATLVMKPMQ